MKDFPGNSTKHDFSISADNEFLLTGVRILLAEDSPDCQLLMKLILRKFGACVDVVSDGEDAVQQAMKNSYNLVLMDIQMPNVNGYEATQRLRALGCQLPILALTAHAMKEERTRCLEVGCNDHLTKPIRPSQLVAAILKYASHCVGGTIH